jgi:outer membrane protein
MRRLLGIIIAATIAAPLSAQTASSSTLTLDEALSIARRNNPQYQQSLNARQRAGWSLRTSYGSLMPSIGASLGLGWREGRPVFIEGQPFGAASDILSSSYSVGLSMNYSYGSLLGPRQQSAVLHATELQVSAREQQIRQQVTVQYVNTIEATRNAALQDSLLRSRETQLDLARAKEKVGSGTALETSRAEVSYFTAVANARSAHNRVEIETARLFQILSVPQPSNVELATELPVVEPKFQAEDLVAEALAHNPSLSASRASERAASIGKRAAISSYFPSLNLSTGIGGATQQLTDARGSDRTWPFDFNRNPLSFSVGFSIPVFNGFNREAQVQNAALALNDRQQDVRQEELQLRSDVAATLLQLHSDWEIIGLRDRAVQTARTALSLAQERYRVGATSYIELTLAVDDYQNAENDRLRAIYQYHRDFAALEFAVGRPLR